jgi:hypothetical protein
MSGRVALLFQFRRIIFDYLKKGEIFELHGPIFVSQIHLVCHSGHLLPPNVRHASCTLDVKTNLCS